MDSFTSKIGFGNTDLNIPTYTSPSKLKTYGFIIAIIVGIGGLAVGGAGVAGCVGAFSNMAQIDAIIMVAVGGGGGIILLIIGIVGTVKNRKISSKSEVSFEHRDIFSAPNSRDQQESAKQYASQRYSIANNISPHLSKNIISNNSTNTRSVNQITEVSKLEAYKKAAQLIFDADVLFISAGAGMGVPGGLGTFRGTAAGVWPPLQKLGLKFEFMSNPARFKENDQYGPNWAWSFWKWRYCAYLGAQLHKGYEYLRDWSNMKMHPSFVFTTNIDGHFLRAGFDKVLERHGTVQFLQCQRLDSTCPNFNKKWLPEKGLIESLQVDPRTDQIIGSLPTCNGCEKTARPTVLMFNDGNVLTEQIEEQMKVYNDWKKRITKSDRLKVVVIEIGAGTAIPTARLESEKISNEFSCPLIRINPEYPEIKNAASGIEHISIAEGAEEALRQINESIQILIQSK